MKVAFHTFGCKVNQYETEGLKEQFAEAGYTIVDDREFADVYIINTCTVTNIADRKSRQYIRRLKHQNPDSVVAVTGCYAQTQPEEVAQVEGVNIVSGTNRKSELLKHVEAYLNAHAGRCGDEPDSGVDTYVQDIRELKDFESTGIIKAMESRTRAYIKIEEGCDRFCSYCVIPYARGTVRSRSAAQILEEARVLVDAGFREIILTGINTALYGTEEGYTCDVDDEDVKDLYGIEIIIALLDKMPGDFRIRLSSVEPTVVNARYVERLTGYNRLCPHLHLSIQSGSDRILGLMNRHYSVEEYMEIVNVLRSKDCNFGITTDIIVGFPGETEEDFCGSMKVTEEAEFCKVHCFQFSERRGTVAAGMEDKVTPSVKKERSERLIEFADKCSENFRRNNLGTVRTVLFEEYLKEEEMITGYSDNYIKIYVRSEGDHLNSFCNVKFTELYRDGLLGELV